MWKLEGTGMARERIDPDAVLCEGCGYEIGGLGEGYAANACPECGRALADSMPGHRKGSPLQREPGRGPGAICRTWWRVVRHPWRVWDEVQPAESGELASRARVLRLCTNAMAVLPVLALLVSVVYAESITPVAAALRWMVPLLAGFFVLLEVLCRIESIGIRTIGRQRGWRVTPGVARAVIAHASVGWLLAAVLIAGGFWLGRWFQGLVGVGRPLPAGDWLGAIVETAPLLFPAVGFLIGMLVFEALVYVGVRRMRFVNRVPAGGEADLAVLDEPRP
ncbi:MAG: hypothetical protein EA378_10000 [Phycisphaerales bacterium]|nr:MAG: hypothetical protein EA378_10000 [Phycisphaerales bacterium]